MSKSGLMWTAVVAAGLMMTMGLAGLFPAVALAAGVNPALIVATNKLTLPTNGTVSVTVTHIRGGASDSFNLFQYTTVTNFSSARWTVTLPENKNGDGVHNDTDAKLIYIRYWEAGTIFMVR